MCEYLEGYGFDIELSPCKIILNNFEVPIINFIVLVIKQMIFSYKCSKEKLTWSKVERELNNLYEIELYNAFTNQKLSKHVNKWRYIKPECTFINDENE